MTGRWRTALVLAFAAAGAAAAVDRAPPEAALGYFESGERAACNGTLIAPRLVLTAAHCVEDRDGRGASDPVRFRAAGADAIPPRRMRGHPIHVMGLSEALSALRFDVALVELLEAPLGADPPAVRVADADADLPETLDVASYEREASDAPRIRTCPVVAERRDLVWLDCEVRSGDSGGAVYRIEDGVMVVHAVMVARSSYLDLPVALAAKVAPRLESVRSRLDAPPTR